MGKRERLLQQCELFEGIEEEAIARLLPCLRGKTATLEPGEELLPQGEEVTQVVVILNGTAQVTDESGKCVISLKAGDHFGGGYACVGALLPDRVTAGAEGCEVFRFEGRRGLTTCDHSCKGHHRLLRNLVRSVAEESLQREEKLRILSQRTTQEKLLAYLRRQAQLQGSAEFVIPMDRQALADYLGVERSAMSTELTKLRKAGVLDCKRSWFKLL